MWYASRMPNTPDRNTSRRISSLENKINYRRHHLETSRASIHAQFDKRDPERMNERQVQHWVKVRDEALARVDDLEARWLAPLEAEYRQLLGLD